MAEHSPLSPTQVATIGRVHHGMLYQHVFAACLVARTIRSPGFFDRIVVERDEDIEMVRGELRLYIQAKAHSGLVFSAHTSYLNDRHIDAAHKLLDAVEKRIELERDRVWAERRG